MQVKISRVRNEKYFVQFSVLINIQGENKAEKERVTVSVSKKVGKMFWKDILLLLLLFIFCTKCCTKSKNAEN